MKKRMLIWVLACALACPALPALALPAEYTQDTAWEDSTAVADAAQSFDAYVEGFGLEAPSDTDWEVLKRLWAYREDTLALLEQLDAAQEDGTLARDAAVARRLEREADALEEDMDTYEDTLEASARAGDFGRDTYRAYEYELEALEDMLDAVEDAVEQYWDD